MSETGLNSDEQIEPITGYSSASSLNITKTSISLELDENSFINPEHYNVLFNSNISGNFWLATRCTYFTDLYVSYECQYISNTKNIYSTDLLHQINNSCAFATRQNNFYYCPIVELKPGTQVNYKKENDTWILYNNT